MRLLPEVLVILEVYAGRATESKMLGSEPRMHLL